MKKLVQINVVCNGSTGRIMCDIAKKAKSENIDPYCFYGRGNPNKDVNCIRIGNNFSTYFHVLLARLGFNGYGSYFSTKKLIKNLKKINPDIIHMHNIHGYYLNLKVLFKYLKKEYKGKIIWTLHDCWSFTGHCSYFTKVNCNKWQKKCFDCPQLKEYPKTFIDRTNSEFKLKKKLFCGLNNLTLVTPSAWLANLVRMSFLNKYRIQVINNGIDLNVFKPTANNDIYEKYNIPKDKKIILGVANIWEERKGLDIFLSLSHIISNEEIIILIGLNELQLHHLPSNIIGIKRTDNIEELRSLYTIANVFLNPSLEETFSLVTVEAISCGTPVVVNDSSAVSELVINNIGYIVNNHRVGEYYKKIKKIFTEDISKDRKRFLFEHSKKYDSKTILNQMISLYKE